MAGIQRLRILYKKYSIILFIRKKVNPILIEIKRQKWENFFRLRNNLYENYLKSPFRV